MSDEVIRQLLRGPDPLNDSRLQAMLRRLDPEPPLRLGRDVFELLRERGALRTVWPTTSDYQEWTYAYVIRRRKQDSSLFRYGGVFHYGGARWADARYTRGVAKPVHRLKLLRLRAKIYSARHLIMSPA
jgi:hypothetical protein